MEQCVKFSVGWARVLFLHTLSLGLQVLGFRRESAQKGFLDEHRGFGVSLGFREAKVTGKLKSPQEYMCFTSNEMTRQILILTRFIPTVKAYMIVSMKNFVF